ncbi:MAG: ribosome maturation factor RimM [Chloroflexota bacterium]
MAGARPPSSTRRPPQYLAVGRVLRPHGVRGELLVEVAPDLVGLISPKTPVYLGPRHKHCVVRSLRRHRRQVLLSLEGCGDREAAERWRGAEIDIRLAELEPLPSGVYYDWQMVGLHVWTESGELLGVMKEILRTGANDVYLVRSASGDELLLPALDSVILEVDLDEGRLLVRLPPGLREEQ